MLVMKQLIIISISVISFFVILSMVSFSPPKPLDSSKIDYSKSWRLQGGIPIGTRLSDKEKSPGYNVVIIKDKMKEIENSTVKNNYEIIDLKKQYLRWSE